MRFDPSYRSDNVEDQRGGGGGRGFGPFGLVGGVIFALLAAIFGRNFGPLAQLLGGASKRGAPAAAEEKELVGLVSTVLDDGQVVFRKEATRVGAGYRDAKLVLFRDEVRSACGTADAAVGPFYCPGDEKVYIDLAFYADLRKRFGAPGDFAQAYVIAHELGHHVQTILGTEKKVRADQRRDKARANELSVRMELQADCYAGVWAHSTQQRALLEKGDVEEALGAASAIGDDRLQKQATGRVNPEKWTHGSSEMRVRWFKKGMAGGRLEDCDTFSVAAP